MKKLTRLLSIILAVIMTASILGISAFAANPTISVSGGTVTVDNEITVDVYLSASSNAAGGNFTLQYDSAKLTPLSFTAGSLVSGYTNNCNLTYSSNSIRFTFSGSNAITSSGKLVSIKFKAKAPGSAALSFTAYKLYNTSGSSITASASGNTITVNSNTSASLTVSGGSVNVNNEITTSIKISSSSNAAGGNFTLQYDNEKLTPISYTSGSLVSGYTNNCNLTYSVSSIRFTFSGSNAITSSGTLLSIKFKAKATGSASLSFTDYKLYNISGSSIPTSVSGNTININTEPATNYIIIYNPNGGSFAPANQSGNGNIILSTTKPIRNGYIFKGWAMSSTTTTAQYQPGDSYNLISNVTFYAVWEKAIYTLSYNANNGSGAPTNQTGNGSITLSTTKPTRSGFTFKGWATSASATTAQYQPGASYNLTANATLYAVWQKNDTPPAQPKVKSVSVSDAAVNYKSSATLKPAITADDGIKYTVKYESSNPSVVSVDNSGKVTGAKKGTATITCTVTDQYGNTVTDTCKVTVKYTVWQWLIIILLFGWIWY